MNSSNQFGGGSPLVSLFQNRWKRVALIHLTVALGCGLAWAATHRSPQPPRLSRPTDAASALEELKAGNLRYVSGHRSESVDTIHDAALRAELVAGQHPFAAIICCADSRLVPEFVFDQHPGSLFEIRNAGNVVDEDVLASVEYAVEHLHVPLVVVMGHSKCGAIQAVHDADGKPLHDHLKAIQSHMHDLDAEIHQTHDDHSQACLDRISDDNALAQTKALIEQCPLLQHAMAHSGVQVATMSYKIESGQVNVLQTSQKNAK